jgi:hypothetical protein
VAGVSIAAALAVLLLSVLFLRHSREMYRRRAETEVQNLCTVLADNLVATFGKIDLSLLALKDELERQMATGHPSGPAIEAFIRRQVAWNPALSGLRTVDAEGIVVFGNDASPGKRIDLSDRDYFIRLKGDPKAGLVFSRPVLGRVRATWVVMMARRINRADGTFAGLVYSALQLEEVRSHFRAVSLGKDGTVGLRGPDLSVIVRYGSGEDTTGQTGTSRAFQELLAEGRTRGVFTARPTFDSVKRIIAFTRIEPYGQYLLVGLSEHEAFGAWRKECLETGLFNLLFLALLGVVAGVQLRSLRAQERIEGEREAVINDLLEALAEVKALSGLLPICAQCKKIRDDTGYWNQLESYLTTHSQAQFTHGICPDCAKVLFPEFRAAGPETPVKGRP